MSADRTTHYLQDWYNGDEEALNRLLGDHLSWIRQRVNLNQWPVLKKVGETMDYIQMAMVRFLHYGPRVIISNGDHFRALILRIVKNTLHDECDYWGRACRNIARQKPLPPTTIVNLDKNVRRDKTPCADAIQNEHEALRRLGMEFLSAEDRKLISMRNILEKSFKEIGETFEIKPDTARKRYNRALSRLGDIIYELQEKRLAELLDK